MATQDVLVEDVSTEKPARTAFTTAPADWRTVRLGEVFKFTAKPHGLKYANFERIPFVPMDAVPVGRMNFDQYILKAPSEVSSGTYFEPGDVLVAKITPSFENGKQGIIESLPTPFGIATTEVIPIKEVPGLSDKHLD